MRASSTSDRTRSRTTVIRAPGTASARWRSRLRASSTRLTISRSMPAWRKFDQIQARFWWISRSFHGSPAGTGQHCPIRARSTSAWGTPNSRSSRPASLATVDLPAPTGPVISSTGTGDAIAASCRDRAHLARSRLCACRAPALGGQTLDLPAYGKVYGASDGATPLREAHDVATETDDLQVRLARAGLPARGVGERQADLPEPLRRFHRHLLGRFLTEAGPPDQAAVAGIAAELGLDPWRALATLAAADVVHAEEATGTIRVAYPFSGRPTAHRVRL